MPAIPIIGAVAAVAGAGAAVVATVNQGKAQDKADQAAADAQAQADAAAKAQADAQAKADADAKAAATQSTMTTSTPTNYPALDAQELAHSIQALANATSEVNLQKNTAQPIDWTKILTFGGIGLVLILLLMRRR